MARGLLISIAPLILAASAPATPVAEPIDAAIQHARAEQQAAERRARTLGRAAASARSEADRLRKQQEAAAQAIEAAEARITAADAQLRLLAAAVEGRRRQLMEQQRPIASLLSGLAVMADRPPLLALADSRSTDEIVVVRALIDATLPVIRRQTSQLSSRVKEDERLRLQLSNARAEVSESREALITRRNRFAELERQVLRSAAVSGNAALSSGDRALAAEEDLERLGGVRQRADAARALATDIARQDPAPTGPGAASPPAQGIDYLLPATATVLDGIGSVSPNGVRSRGITLATPRGAAIVAPAPGVVRFSGPYKSFDGVVIIDHGGGWVSLLVGVASPLQPGRRVRQSEPLGRALGPIQVELSQNGRRVSPAIIAGSSRSLSKRGKGG